MLFRSMKDGRPVEFRVLVKDFYAYFKENPAPILAGDPLHTDVKEPSGLFYQEQIDRKSVV